MNLFRMGNPTIVTMKLLISEIFLASYKKSADPSTSALSFSIVIMWPVQTLICGHEGGGDVSFLFFSTI